jgi:hypothetical protein
LKMKRAFPLILLLIILLVVNAPVSSANSAEPPSILIIVPNAPHDLEISINNIQARRTEKSFESYYTFYRSDLRSAAITLDVSTGGSNFSVILDSPLKSYNNVFTLDINQQTLIPGKLLLRDISLVSLRVILTLIIEGLVFFLFGFRKLRSWLIFLIVNLITQGLLNILLTSSNIPSDSYIIFPLVGGEILVFITEMIVFSFTLGEHSRLRVNTFVVTANFLSLIAGGYLITVLPL